jgi:hypothetical protein
MAPLSLGTKGRRCRPAGRHRLSFRSIGQESACAVRCASAALIDKSDAAGSSAPPHYMAARCRFEIIKRQIKIESKNVKRALNVGSLIVEISHHATVDIGIAVQVKHRGLIDFNALKGSTVNHQNASKKIGSKFRTVTSATYLIGLSLKVRTINLLKLYRPCGNWFSVQK